MAKSVTLSEAKNLISPGRVPPLSAIIYTLLICLFASFLLPDLPAAAKEQPEFSATLLIREGKTTTHAKMHYSKNAQRMEMQSEDMGGKSVVITRLDKGLVWVLLTPEKVYMETPISQRQANPLGQDPGSIIKRQKVGKEKVDGHPCIKEKVTVKDADGGSETMYYWEATDIGWAVKAEAMDGSWSYTYKDIKMGRQDPSLFEVPKGYSKMETTEGEPSESPEPTEPIFPGPEEPTEPESPGRTMPGPTPL